MSEPITLVATRLAEMWRVHPKQDNSHQCSQCGERVGIYPSGQKALKANPQMRIMCSVCAMRDYEARPFGDREVRPAGRWDEILQESRDSQDVGEA